MYGRLQAQRDRLRSASQANRVEQIEVVAEITEAWQKSRRDYVTAHISGSRVDYTIDETGDRLVAGSRTHPRRVEDCWTFMRPAGLTYGMLSAEQGRATRPAEEPTP